MFSRFKLYPLHNALVSSNTSGSNVIVAGPLAPAFTLGLISITLPQPLEAVGFVASTSYIGSIALVSTFHLVLSKKII